MDHIVSDRTGELRRNILFHLEVVDDDFPPVLAEYTEGILIQRTPTNDELLVSGEDQWMQAQWVVERGSKVVEYNRCPNDPTHITESYVTALHVDLVRGQRMPDFIVTSVNGKTIPIVTDEFARKLRESGLTGFHLERVTVRHNKVSSKTPKLFQLHFMGRNCERPHRVRGAPNACPFCGREPLICQKCGVSFSFCRTCREGAWQTRKWHTKHPESKKLIVSPPETRYPSILEAKRWDGSDFVYGRYGEYITKRAFDWLLSIHAAPFFAGTALVDVGGLDQKQLERIELAKSYRPPGIDTCEPR